MTVALEPLTRDHLALLRSWINDPRVAVPFLFARQVGEEEHLHWFNDLEADLSQFLLAVVATGRHVGALGFKNIDTRGRSGEMWIYLDPKMQGAGIGSKAVIRGTEFAFEELRLDRVSLVVRADNAAARRIYEKAGFTDAGDAQRSATFEDVPVTTMILDEPCWRRLTGRGPAIAMMQPIFLPWLGYFELMDAVDVFIVLDDFQFTRHSWAHRNRLLLAGKPTMVSLPIRHPGTLNATFLDIAEAEPERWRRKLIRGIEQNYRRAPQYASIRRTVDAWLAAPAGSVGALEISWLETFSRYIGSRCQIRRSSEFATRHLRRSARVLKLLEAMNAGTYYAASSSFDYMAQDGMFPTQGPKVLFQNHLPVPYPQGKAESFVSHLSALDAAFNLEPAELRRVLRGTRQWLTWDERARLRRRATAPGNCHGQSGDHALL